LRVQLIGDHVLRHGAHDRVDDLAPFENEQRGDGADAILHGDAGVVIDIDLGDRGLAIILVGEFIDQGGDGAARTAPRGPEVDEEQLTGFDLLLELVVGEMHGMCHDASGLKSEENR
jgi:hypothetical protein